jgi:hypothetical protein
MRRLAQAAAVAGPLLIGIFGAWRAGAIERNFAGSAQLDYMYLPSEPSTPNVMVTRSVFDGFTSEVALKLAVDVSDRLSANVKLCHGCHGFELPMAYFDYRLADELNFRVGRFSPSFGAFNVRHDPANHATSSKPLPYDMGRMLRWQDWNLGVIPSPFPDNGVEVNGTHWFADTVQMDYAVYAVSGFRGDPTTTPDLDWSLSLSQQERYLVDNNGRPAVGGRSAFTFRTGDNNDFTIGASLMYGTYDPANTLAYTIGGADFAARVGRTQIRAEYLVRHQSFDYAGTYKLPVSGLQTFNKHGYYLEAERSMTETISLVARIDGLYRTGNVLATSSLEPKAAIIRYTGGATLSITPGWRLKASAELWAFSNNAAWGFSDFRPVYDQLELGLHLGLVGTF